MSTINAETIRRWVEEMWNGRQYSLCRELIAPEFVEHAHAPFSPDPRASVRWESGLP